MPDVPASTVSATISAANYSHGTKSSPIIFIDVTNCAFDVGEKLKFVIKYEFLSGGSATMEVHEGPVTNGRRTMTIESRAESNKMISAFFRVMDYNASLID